LFGFLDSQTAATLNNTILLVLRIVDRATPETTLARSSLIDFLHPKHGQKTQINGSKINSAPVKETEIAGS
jgi:hypothetical protein